MQAILDQINVEYSDTLILKGYNQGRAEVGRCVPLYAPFTKVYTPLIQPRLCRGKKKSVRGGCQNFCKTGKTLSTTLVITQ